MAARSKFSRRRAYLRRALAKWLVTSAIVFGLRLLVVAKIRGDNLAVGLVGSDGPAAGRDRSNRGEK